MLKRYGYSFTLFFSDMPVLPKLENLNHGPAEPRIFPAFANSADPDQLASKEANWSGSALFVILYVNLHRQPRSTNLIGWQLKVGVTS